MVQSEARVATEMATRYLGQLCKHFEHRLTVSYTKDTGRIEFGAGICSLHAGDGVLTMRAESPDDESLAQLQDVVARHLARFAFRDTPEIAWRRLQA
jgi:hypothetical protein